MDGVSDHHLWRKKIEEGTLLGPHMIIASRAIGKKNISEAEARSEVKNAKRVRADFIKVHDSLSRSSYYAILDEATQSGLSVQGHVPFSITAEEASSAGQRSIEHFTGLDGVAHDSIAAKSLFTIFKKNNTWVCPTLVMRHNYTILTDRNLINDMRLKYLQSSSTNWWINMVKESNKVSEEEWKKEKS